MFFRSCSVTFSENESRRPLDFGDEEIDFINREKRDFFNLRGSAQVFSWLLYESNSRYRLWRLGDCVRFAIKICGLAYQPEIASLMRTILDGRLINPTLCNLQDNNWKTVLHCAALHLGERWAEWHEINTNSELFDMASVFFSEESEDKIRNLDLLRLI